MLTLEILKNLNYQNEENFVDTVKRLVEKTTTTDLDPEKMYILRYDRKSGTFYNVDIILNTETRKYSENAIVSPYNRLWIGVDDKGVIATKFDGLKIQNMCDYYDGTWETAFLQVLGLNKTYSFCSSHKSIN